MYGNTQLKEMFDDAIAIAEDNYRTNWKKSDIKFITNEVMGQIKDDGLYEWIFDKIELHYRFMDMANHGKD